MADFGVECEVVFALAKWLFLQPEYWFEVPKIELLFRLGKVARNGHVDQTQICRNTSGHRNNLVESPFTIGFKQSKWVKRTWLPQTLKVDSLWWRTFDILLKILNGFHLHDKLPWLCLWVIIREHSATALHHEFEMLSFCYSFAATVRKSSQKI